MMGRRAGQNRLRSAVRALSESEANNRVCQRIAGRIACITSTNTGGKTMATRTGSAVWEGTLKQGKGTTKLGSGAFEGPYSFSSRFEEGKGTNPEEMIGAAEAACYSMALSANLEKAGHPAKRIRSGSGSRCTEREGYLFGFDKIGLLLNPNDHAMHLNRDGAENRTLDLPVANC